MKTISSSATPERPRKSIWSYLGLLPALLAMIIFFSIKSQNFLTWGTFQMIANQIPALAVMATGMTYVLIIGGIDLSVGSVLAFSAAVMGMAMVKLGINMPLAIIMGLAIGLACGAITGVITVWGIPSFIMSLGMLEMARSGAYFATDQRTEYIGGDIGIISEPLIYGISPAFLAAIVIIIAGQVVLTRTVLGRKMIGIGTNEEAMRLAGIDPRPIKIGVFALMGVLAAIGGVFQTSRAEAADPGAGTGMELQVIAAVVIGGTSLMGGRGSVFATFVGVLIMAVLETGLAQIGASEQVKRFITGLIIIAAVGFDVYRTRMQVRRG